jgi:hypothetical protein
MNPPGPGYALLDARGNAEALLAMKHLGLKIRLD